MFWEIRHLKYTTQWYPLHLFTLLLDGVILHFFKSRHNRSAKIKISNRHDDIDFEVEVEVEVEVDRR